ncbi:MAG: hypothetical protein HKP30_12480 [Myxococcales bacterium]|nr:hypothetical protein [Myxococcales bacterium]
MSGNLLALLAVCVVAGAGAFWFQRLNAVRAGEVRGRVIAAMALGSLLGLLAFASGTSVFGGIAAGVALLLGGTFLFLQPFSGQARTTPAATVGQPIVAFSATDDAGEPFSLASLAGRPFLLKFFRGHW